MLSQNRDQLVNSLKGQEVTVSSPASIFGAWPSSQSKHYQTLVNIVNEKIACLPFGSEKLARLRRADFAQFTCVWWPDADLESLSLAAHVTIWLFVWDDELDQPTGSLTNDLEAANVYRRQTADFVEQSLRLKARHEAAQEVHPLIAFFEPIGEKMRASYSMTQRRRVLHEIKAYIAATKSEQVTKLKGEIWSLDEYWRVRLGASAVDVASSIAEYTRKTRLPDYVMESQEMHTIWHETNMIVSMVNDLLSAKKELAHGCVDSFIPLAFASGISPQMAANKAVSELRNRVASFDQAASTLVNRVQRIDTQAPLQNIDESPSDSQTIPSKEKVETLKALHGFITTLRQNCVGNMVWSLTTPRYGLANCPRNEKGAVRITL